MRRKATIRPSADGWTVTRPAFGFSPTDTTERAFATREEAFASLTPRTASAAAQVVQAGKPVRPTRARRTTNYPLEIQ